jgi:hypothetical protein
MIHPKMCYVVAPALGRTAVNAKAVEEFLGLMKTVVPVNVVTRTERSHTPHAREQICVRPRGCEVLN